METLIDNRQVGALRLAGLNDQQICSALGISEEELVKSAVDAVVKSQGADTDYGPLMSFTEDQITMARNQIAALALTGDSDAVKLRACNLILNLHSVTAESRYRNAKGLDKAGVTNNIMIAVVRHRIRNSGWCKSSMETEILTPDEIESRELFAKIMAEQAAFSNRASSKPTSRPPETSPALSPGPTPPAPPNGFDPAYGLNDLVDVWNLMFPEMDLYAWQAEELLRMSGYITGRLNGPRVHFTEQDPYLATYVCSNGSGKDKILISTAAIGLPLLYRDVIVVITSSSNEQLKFQTENHITRGIAALNARLSQPVYESIHYYHRCAARRRNQAVCH